MPLFGPEQIPVVREALMLLYRVIPSLRGEIGGRPVPGSPYANELSLSRRKESLDTARSISLMLIESGGEHMTAFVKMLTEPMEPIACWTCIRDMLEPCARAAWLLDPAIDADTRIKRTFAVRFNGMEQDLKFARAMNQPKQNQDKIEKRIATVELDAIALGFPKLRDQRKKKRIVGIGVMMPTATDMIKGVLDEEGAYRIFSAVSHGQAGTIRQLSYAPVSGSGSTVQMGGGSARAFKKTVDPDRMAWLGLIAARALARPIWYEFGYAGWDRSQLRNLFEEKFDRLGAKAAVRFWR